LSSSRSTVSRLVYSLSLHDALPISDLFEPRRLTATSHVLVRRNRSHLTVFPPAAAQPSVCSPRRQAASSCLRRAEHLRPDVSPRSEEHTSELQSREKLVGRLLLEKK